VIDYVVYGLRIGFEKQSIVQPKDFEAKIPSMKDHEAFFAPSPNLRGFTAFERFKKIAAGHAWGASSRPDPRAVADRGDRHLTRRHARGDPRSESAEATTVAARASHGRPKALPVAPQPRRPLRSPPSPSRPRDGPFKDEGGRRRALLARVDRAGDVVSLDAQAPGRAGRRPLPAIR